MEAIFQVMNELLEVICLNNTQRITHPSPSHIIKTLHCSYPFPPLYSPFPIAKEYHLAKGAVSHLPIKISHGIVKLAYGPI